MAIKPKIIYKFTYTYVDINVLMVSPLGMIEGYNTLYSKIKDIAIDTRNKILDEKDRSYEEFGKSVGIGADGTDTNLLDKISEDYIISSIEKKELPVNILSEEAGIVDRGYKRFVIIDPIDGSYNAVNGIPFYSISMALTNENEETEYGIVLNIPSGDIYEAIAGKGAYVNGKAAHTDAKKQGRNTLGIYLGKHSMPGTGNMTGNYRRVRNLGCASMEMILVSGPFDAFVQKGRGVRIVDIAASCLFLKESGGVVMDGNGHPLNMDLDVKKRYEIIAAKSTEIVEDVICELESCAEETGKMH